MDFPGEGTWTTPGRDGVFALETNDEVDVLHYLAGPEQEPRILLGDVRVAFATTSGRIVFERVHGPDERPQLSVMLPDERVVELGEGSSWSFGPYAFSSPRPLDHDEVLYGASKGDGWVLRRTVLP